MDINALGSIMDCESNCGINNASGIFLKFTKNEIAEIVTIEFTNM